MKEIEHLTEIFADLYNGDPWIDVTFIGTLKNISAEAAANKVNPQLNSIWEIVNHIIRWRENVLQRSQGKIATTPPDNYFTLIEDQSEQAWQNTLDGLNSSQLDWIAFFQKMNEDDLDKIHPGNSNTNYKNIYGIIQHDAYHLGQIVLLAKHYLNR